MYSPTKWIVITFSISIKFITFFLFYFFFDTFLFQFDLNFSVLFHKSSNNFFIIKVFYCICLWYFYFFLSHKNFYQLIWSVAFCKNVFIFWYSDKITNFKFRIFIIIFKNQVNVHTRIYNNMFQFDCYIANIVVFINYLINKYTHCLMLESYISKFRCLKF